MIHELAWLKMLVLRNTDTEIAALGITPFQDPFVVTDFVMVGQENSAAFVEFKDDAMAEFQADMVFNKGLNPDQFRRVWVHTHPGFSATPSHTDWTTFSEHFADMDWSVMLIIGKGRDYATVNPKVVDITAVLRVRTVPHNHEQSGQHPIWVDTDMVVDQWTNEKRPPWRTLDDVPLEELLKLPIAEWLGERDQAVSIPKPPPTPYYTATPSAGNEPVVSRDWLTPEQKKALITLEVPWDKIQARYGMHDKDLAILKLDTPRNQEDEIGYLELALEEQVAVNGAGQGGQYHGE